MESTIINVKSNFGNDKVTMKIFSPKQLSVQEKEYFRSLKRDEAIKYGRIKGWKVIDVTELI